MGLEWPPAKHALQLASLLLPSQFLYFSNPFFTSLSSPELHPSQILFSPGTAVLSTHGSDPGSPCHPRSPPGTVHPWSSKDKLLRRPGEEKTDCKAQKTRDALGPSCWAGFFNPSGLKIKWNSVYWMGAPASPRGLIPAPALPCWNCRNSMAGKAAGKRKKGWRRERSPPCLARPIPVLGDWQHDKSMGINKVVCGCSKSKCGVTR